MAFFGGTYKGFAYGIFGGKYKGFAYGNFLEANAKDLPMAIFWRPIQRIRLWQIYWRQIQKICLWQFLEANTKDLPMAKTFGGKYKGFAIEIIFGREIQRICL